MKISIGIDSVDSSYGGCTTHALHYLFKKLLERDYLERALDYPYLVRLNPSIPSKTRGNGAVALNIEIRDSVSIECVASDVAAALRDYITEVRGNTSRACVALALDEVGSRFRELYFKALTDFVHLDYIAKLVSESRDKLVLPLGFSEGCIGALAAIGWDRSRCTYELLIYRDVARAQTIERVVDTDTLAELDRHLEYRTFCNYDYEEERAISIPRGPDPVLLGIRGLDPVKLIDSVKNLKIGEAIGGWLLFKTNQASGAHLAPRASTELKPFRTGCLTGVVIDITTRPGGDVLLEITDGYGSMRAAVFKETGLTRYIRNLVLGDVVRVCGSTKLWDDLKHVLHVELVEVIDLVENYVKNNPKCPKCSARMKSAGRGKGFKCVKCGFKSRNLHLEATIKPREVGVGLYLPGCRSAKHLSIPAPLSKAELENCGVRPSSTADFYF